MAIVSTGCPQAQSAIIVLVLLILQLVVVPQIQPMAIIRTVLIVLRAIRELPAIALPVTVIKIAITITQTAVVHTPLRLIVPDPLQEAVIPEVVAVTIVAVDVNRIV